MSDEAKLLQRISRELDAQVEAHSPALQGRLRAARREALQGKAQHASRFWKPALAASLLITMVSTIFWTQWDGYPDSDGGMLLQASNESDMQMLHAGDDIDLYQNLEFYYWMEQGQADAG